jgi:cysteinyl-tRNA synthetase
VREFRPVTRGKASVYLCGATVQGAPHLGHLRSAICFDILVRWLEASGYQVTYCRNVADIDDTVLAAAAAEGIPWWALAERNRRELAAACRVLGCRPPDVEPRAAGHIPDMITLIERLMASGHAYLAGGNVCFDIGTADDYNALSPRSRADELGAVGDADGTVGKRDPGDFVLWRAARPGEPAWRAPWGPGRPGRHIECSAMASGYLGSTFDIHGGGRDLIFPHHENERVQSVSAGDPFARYWVHHGLVTVGGAKMSRSAGNSLAVADALRRVRPQELRYYLAQAHYRTSIEYSPGALEDAVAAYQRIERFVTRAQHLAGPVAPPLPAALLSDPSPPVRSLSVPSLSVPSLAALPISFAAAMDDDLGVPAALTAVHATVHDGNYALSTGNLGNAVTCLAQVRAMLAVLGLDPLAPGWRAGDPDGRADDPDGRLRQMVDSLISLALSQREAARERGDYASADSIRDTLEDTGVVVEDTPEGPRWELAR